MAYEFDWDIIEKARAEAKAAKHAKNKARRKAKRKQYQHEYYLRVTKPKRKEGNNGIN